MGFAHMLIYSINSALEEREHAFNCICIGVSSYVFVSGMINGSMRRKLFTDAPIDAAFIGSEMGFPRSDGDDQRTDGLRRDIRDMERTRLAATLDKRKDGFLRRRSLVGAVPGP